MNVARPERVLLNFSAPSTFAEFMSLVGPTPDELDSLNTFQYLAETVRYAILPFLDPELAVLDRLRMLWCARTRILLMELDASSELMLGIQPLTVPDLRRPVERVSNRMRKTSLLK